MELSTHTTHKTEVALLYPPSGFLALKIAHPLRPSPSPYDHNIMPAYTYECGKGSTIPILYFSCQEPSKPPSHSIHIIQCYLLKVLFSSSHPAQEHSWLPAAYYTFWVSRLFRTWPNLKTMVCGRRMCLEVEKTND